MTSQRMWLNHLVLSRVVWVPDDALTIYDFAAYVGLSCISPKHSLGLLWSYHATAIVRLPVAAF
jgi:hypothetical protein